TKTDNVDPVTAGNNLTYTITVDSAGPSDALGVAVSDPIPAGTTFVSAPGGTYSAITNTVTWNLGTVAQSDSAVVLSLVVKVDAGRTTGLSNTASVTSTTTDPDTTNNSATELTAVHTRATPAITKTDNVDPVTAGNNL